MVTSYVSGSGLRDPIGIALDDSGNVYSSNWQNGRIYKITPEQQVTLFATIPGGTINQITYANGTLYVPSPSLNKIFSLTLDGTLTLLAGTGQAGSQNGPALEATFDRPNSIAASLTGDTLYVIDANPGVIRMITLDVGTSIDDTNPEMPASIRLDQNYPNPFTLTTKITYSLPAPGFVSLKIYDLLGREVRSLVHEIQEARQHSVAVSAVNLVSGVYLYRLETDHFRETKTMLLVR